MASAGVGSFLTDLVDKQKKLEESKANSAVVIQSGSPSSTSSPLQAEGGLTAVEEEVVGTIEAFMQEESKWITPPGSVETLATRQEQLLYEIKAKDALVRNLKVRNGV